jgi:hypothetical protein
MSNNETKRRKGRVCADWTWENHKDKEGWTDYGGTFLELFEEGFGYPGMLIRDEDDRINLIGSVSMAGGTCDCCAEVYDHTVVKSYKLACDVLPDRKGDAE